ncbi:gfo/Idh/MocA family oxidoreductase [Xylanibacillus composti]|uniref:Gfo/Idh/MocA family oxidoreductase n=1 Tax=Xylanibacillus composti TaxID=1572762 RepID=A0A8J4H7S7_9BACL|nr:Gfo/Idh/MocA family oxidoreductase [Xylanibacillus composti]MDT9726764.1 gfo/Idh/MocA family oxidoreductase [Xylanibacillus composti]GIQ71470.1 gfo/Idh/MocA family oxidoreductase [Xylanibacillus composti]
MSISQRWRVAVIGCGKIAQVRHIPELVEHPGVELVALCDQNKKRAKALADQYRIPLVFSSVKELLGSTDLDGAVICVPNALHADVGLQAMRAGAHVLVEKPLATTPRDCQRLVETADRLNKVLLVGHNQRLHPVYRRVKEIVREGTIGPVIQFTANFQHGGPEGWSVDGAGNWFLDRELSGLGVLGDLGVHKIDLMRWLLDDAIADMQAFTGCRRDNVQVEDHAALLLRLSGGCLGTINLSWCNPLQDHRMVLYGEKGNLIAGESMTGIRVVLHNGETYTEEAELFFRQDKGIRSGVIDEFVRAMQAGTGRDSVLNGHDALHAMEALFRQRGSGKEDEA